jgi:hypothetical protein
MKKARLLLLALPLLLQSFNATTPTGKTAPAKKWVSLFNGKNMDHWTPKFAGYKAGENYKNTFRVENGLLSTRYNQYDSFQNKFGALYYDKKFSNYRLRVEYRFVGDTVHGAPSWGFRDGGIQYHCQAPESMGVDQPFPVCLEYNLHGGNGTEERPTGEICANGMYVEINGKRNESYCTLPTVKHTFTDEQWVVAEVEVRNGKVTHFVNGEKILEFQNPHYDTANAIAKTLIAGGNDLFKDGFISLQSNSNPMDFRKIEILEY